MAELKGITGKIARVDLSTDRVTVIEPPEEVYKKFLGGRALGLYYLYKEGIVEPNVMPFDPQNMYQVMVGPVNGIGCNSRSTIVTKSPYNFSCVSTCGGHTSTLLKFAGWDGIQVVGRADSPVFISIIDDTVEILDASDVWGLSAEEAELKLKKKALADLERSDVSWLTPADMTPKWANLHPPDPDYTIGAKRLAGVWLIGRGGENRVWYAATVTEGVRAHGRYGDGAIAGSKNLKGIVVRGTKGHALADKAAFLDAMRNIKEAEKTQYFWRKYGTSGIGSLESNITGGYPVRNWQYESWSDPEAVRAFTGPFIDKSSFVRKQACAQCWLKCTTYTEITSEDGLIDGKLTDMPDWEALGMVGGTLGFIFPEEGKFEGLTPADPYPGDHNDAMEALAKLQYTTWLHDSEGLDYIEGGNLLAMLMELRQRGLVGPEDLDGIDMKWGDVHAVDAILKKIIHREGIGDVLANGTWETAKYFADKKGKPEIMYYSMTGHRYGQPAHGTRSGFDQHAMSYITVVRPCEHTGGGGGGFKAGDLDAAIAGQDGKAAVDSMVYCLFASGFWGAQGNANVVRAATGWTDFDDKMYMDVGTRCYALERLFNIHTQEIYNPKEEWDSIKMFPNRWWEEPLPTGPFEGSSVNTYLGDPDTVFNEVLPNYWEKRGWTRDKGIPTAEKLLELGLDFAEPIAAKYR